MNDQPVRHAQEITMRSLRELILENEVEIKNLPLVEEANYENILWLMDHALLENDNFPVDKTGRWIGFVQCALIVRGLLDTKSERDRTRALFHEAYKLTGQKIPPTADRPAKGQQ